MVAVQRPVHYLRSDYTVDWVRYLIAPDPVSVPLVGSKLDRREVLYSDNDEPWNKVPKDCLHHQFDWTPHPCNWRQYDTDHAERLKQEYRGWLAEVDPIAGIERYLNTRSELLAPPDWDKVVYKAIPNLRNGMNLINNLLELDDLPKLVHKLKSVGEGYLRYAFGLKPLYADVKAFYRNLADILFNIDAYNRRLAFQGISSTSNSTDTVVHEEQITASGIESSAMEVSVTYDFTIQIRWGVKIRALYSSDRLSRLLDVLGIYPDLSTVWNAIPFSFLVDYFVPVAEALESPPWTSLEVRSIEACRSVTVDGRYTVRPLNQSWLDWNGKLNVVDAGTLGIGTFRYYRREAFPDAALDGIDLDIHVGVPSGKQQINIAALLEANKNLQSPLPRKRRLGVF